MLGLTFDTNAPLSLLVVGAHADDIEIGCGATILRLVRENPGLNVDWLVVSAVGERSLEAQRSADAYLEGSGCRRVRVWEFRDGFLPFLGEEVKHRFEELKHEIRPSLVFTHYRDDRHQDHRLVSDLTWNTFRDSLVLEYEIPKWDGDLGVPNFYVEADARTAHRKLELLNEQFPSQRERDWFDDETFLALMRLRGVECRSASRYAEAFYARKLLLSPQNQSGACQ